MQWHHTKLAKLSSKDATYLALLNRPSSSSSSPGSGGFAVNQICAIEMRETL
jgi:hypothetical protein